jgi:hypothetical protein
LATAERSSIYMCVCDGPCPGLGRNTAGHPASASIYTPQLIIRRGKSVTQPCTIPLQSMSIATANFISQTLSIALWLPPPWFLFLPTHHSQSLHSSRSPEVSFLVHQARACSPRGLINMRVLRYLHIIVLQVIVLFFNRPIRRVL